MESGGNLSLGKHLKRLREERKLTLGAVERLTEGHEERINKSYLFRVERGKTMPTIPRLRVLAKIYHVKLSKLLEVLETAYDEERQEVDLGITVSDLGFEEIRVRGIEAENEGDFPRATLLYRAAWDRALKDPPCPERMVRIAQIRHDLSIALRKMGRIDLAREEAEEALEQDGLPGRLLDKIRLSLADVYCRLGRTVLAREILDGVLARKDEISVETLCGAHSTMGTALLRKEPREAARHLRLALASTRQRKSPFEECSLLLDIGIAEIRAGNFSRALKSLQRALDLARRKEFYWVLAKVQSEIGRALFLKGDRSAAKSAFREANNTARHREYFEQLFVNCYYQRRMALDDGDVRAACTMEASLKFFSTRLEQNIEELEAFRSEPQEEGRQ